MALVACCNVPMCSIITSRMLIYGVSMKKEPVQQREEESIHNCYICCVCVCLVFLAARKFYSSCLCHPATIIESPNASCNNFSNKILSLFYIVMYYDVDGSPRPDCVSVSILFGESGREDERDQGKERRYATKANKYTKERFSSRT